MLQKVFGSFILNSVKLVFVVCVCVCDKTRETKRRKQFLRLYGVYIFGCNSSRNFYVKSVELLNFDIYL